MKNKITKVMHGKLPWIAALLLVIISITCYQTYAWFAHQKKIAELQKVKEPNQLFISAAYAEDVLLFQIPKIDVSDTEVTSAVYPFAVAGEYVNHFTLQLAHTTNVPFTYKIYEATAYETDATGRVAYTVGEQWTEFATLTFDQRKKNGTSLQGTTLYLGKGSEVQGQYLNDTTSNGRKIATNLYHEESFGAYAKTNVQSMQESYDLVSEQFRLGLKNIIELTSGKTNLLQAEQQLLQSKYTTLYNLAMLRFYQGEAIKL